MKAPIIQTGPSISSKDLNDIKEAIKKIAELEERMKGINLDAINKKISHISDELNKKADKVHVDQEISKN